MQEAVCLAYVIELTEYDRLVRDNSEAQLEETG